MKRAILPLTLSLMVASGLLTSNVSAKPPQDLKFSPLSFKPPKVEKRVLTSGVTVFLLRDTELPLINATALVRTGTMYEAPDKTGVASLCGTLLRGGGTLRRKPDAIDEELEFLGASVESGMDVESAGVSFSTLKKDLDPVLAIYADVLQHPAFDKTKLEIEKAKIIEGIRRRNDDPFQIARREFRKLLYGNAHPLSRTLEIPQIKKISQADLKGFYARYYHPNNMMLAISGDFEIDEMVRKLETAFKAWPKAAVAYPEISRVDPARATGKQVGIASKKLNQSSVILGHLGIKRHNPDRFAIEVMNEILGGSAFSSRMYKEVRTKRGLAYWVGSNFSEPYDYGTMAAGSQTKSESTGETLGAMLAEINRIRSEKVTPDELRLARDSIINSFVFRYASSHSIVSQKMTLEYYGYAEDYLDTFTDKIAKVTAEDVQRAAQKYLHPDHLTFMVVGDPLTMKLDVPSFGQAVPIDLKIPE